MAWIESHQSLSRHRKTLRAAALLRCDRHKLIGHLHELWWWALDNVPSDGALNGTLDEEIEGGAEWDGEPGAFVDALTRSGFIDVATSGSRFLHDWYEFAGKLLTRREDNRERQRRKRERDRVRDEPSSVVVRNANVTRDTRVTSPGTSRLSHGATVPNPTQPNRTTHVPTEHEAPATADAAPDAPLVPAGRSIAVYEPTGGAGEHNALWDAFTDVFGEARGKTERQRRGEACKRSREANATPDEIRAAAAHWPNVMGDATLTELGIVANLGKLLHGPQVNGRSTGVTVGLHRQATQRAALRASPEDELAQALRSKR